MRLIAWSSDVVSSDLEAEADQDLVGDGDAGQEVLPGTVVALTRGQDGRDDDVARVDEGAGEALGALGGVGVGAVDERGTEGRDPAAAAEDARVVAFVVAGAERGRRSVRYRGVQCV